jgi:Tol biopolymer transport system component/DNA-binding winged helix-turn-helix (wHTH) protein
MSTDPEQDGPTKVQFGVFEADLRSGELRRSGVRVRIQTQPFRLLVELLRYPGEVVSREELQLALWGADTTVDFDHSLGIAVNKLRDALGDSAENPRFVETLAKRGYRFIAPVKVLDPAPVEAAAAPVAEPAATAAPTSNLGQDRWHRAAIGAAAGLAAIALLLGGILVFRPQNHEPWRIRQITHTGRVLENDVEVESLSSSASDGARLYFSHIENGSPVLAEALTANGELSTFPLPSEIGAPLIGSLSPDNSRLIVRSHLQADPEQPLWIVPTLGGDARRVPNILAHDATWMPFGMPTGMPAGTPEGQRLLIASGSDLLTVAPDGSDLRKFLTVPGRAFWMRWSPDGKTLRYTLRDPQRQTIALWEVNADGSNPHPLLPNWSQPAAECCGSWTGDGQRYVFQSWHSGHSEIWSMRERPWLERIWHWRQNAPSQITNGPLDFEAPSSPPNSRKVDFIGVNSQIDLLAAVPTNSSGSSSFTALAFTSQAQDLSSAALAVYSRDGQWVAWLNAADGSLWRSRADGRERIEVTTPPLRIFNMKWSPDNRTLALMAEDPGKPWKVYLVKAEGDIPTPVLKEDRNEADPDWSADGKSIIFGRLPDRMETGQPKAIYQLNLETRQLTEIPGSAGLFSPRLSPDGRYIAAIRLDQKALMLYDTTTQHWTTLAEHGVGDPTWAHDSRSVYFQDFLEAGKPIYRIAIPGGQPQPVATIQNLRPIAATDFRLIGLAPGDRPIVSARTSSVNLYEVDLSER